MLTTECGKSAKVPLAVMQLFLYHVEYSIAAVQRAGVCRL